MYRVRGLLSNGKAFRFDASATSLAGVVTELEQKLAAQQIDATVTRVQIIAPKSAPSAELSLVDAPKRERKPGSGKKKGARAQ